MSITDEKLKAAIQIALGTHGLYTEKIESDLIHHIKALSIPIVVKSLPTCYLTELDKIQQLAQNQESTRHQIEVLRAFANKLGLYDAADYLRQK